MKLSTWELRFSFKENWTPVARQRTPWYSTFGVVWYVQLRQFKVSISFIAKHLKLFKVGTGIFFSLLVWEQVSRSITWGWREKSSHIIIKVYNSLSTVYETNSVHYQAVPWPSRFTILPIELVYRGALLVLRCLLCSALFTFLSKSIWNTIFARDGYFQIDANWKLEHFWYICRNVITLPKSNSQNLVIVEIGWYTLPEVFWLSVCFAISIG